MTSSKIPCPSCGFTSPVKPQTRCPHCGCELSSTRWNTHTPAYLRRRLFAALLDHAIAIPLSHALLLLIMQRTGPLSHGYQLLWLQFLYPTYFFLVAGLTSTSLGKKLLGVIIVDQQTGARITWKHAFLREVIGRQLNAFLFPVGLVGVRRSYSRAQTIADEVGHTVVVRKKPKKSQGEEG